MNETRVRGMLGFAVKAGQVSFGEEACRILIRGGKCGVMLLDGGAGASTRKKAETMCRAEEVPLMILPAGLMAEATGRGNIAAAVKKGPFAEQLAGCL